MYKTAYFPSLDEIRFAHDEANRWLKDNQDLITPISISSSVAFRKDGTLYCLVSILYKLNN